MRSRAQQSRVAESSDRWAVFFEIPLAMLRLLLQRPKDSLVAIVAAVAVCAIVINSLFLQPGPHPSPIFPVKPLPVATGETTAAVEPVLPKPRPVAEPSVAKTESVVPVRSRTDITADIQRELARRGFFDGTVDGLYGARTDAAIREFEQAAGRKTNAEPSEALLRDIQRSTVKAPPPAPATPVPARTAKKNDPIADLIAPSRQLMAVQRALADFGYGQVKPTGLFDPETKLAIERFERERRLPVTGQASAGVIRELAARTGRPLE